MLDGANMYDAGDMHGKMVAEKRLLFRLLPPVLIIHLKRFRYDQRSKMTTKVNDE